MEGLLGKITLGFFLALILVAVVCRIVLMHSTKDRYVKLIGKRIITCCLTMGFLGLLLFFFSYEGIQLFGARFWYPLWDLGMILWIVVLVRFAIKDVPAMRERDLKQHAKSKYLGHKK